MVESMKGVIGMTKSIGMEYINLPMAVSMQDIGTRANNMVWESTLSPKLNRFSMDCGKKET